MLTRDLPHRRLFSMQLSQKTAMLFFIYVTATFASQKEILERAIAYGDRIRAPKK
jgi:hypothetical protein